MCCPYAKYANLRPQTFHDVASCMGNPFAVAFVNCNIIYDAFIKSDKRDKRPHTITAGNKCPTPTPVPVPTLTLTPTLVLNCKHECVCVLPCSTRPEETATSAGLATCARQLSAGAAQMSATFHPERCQFFNVKRLTGMPLHPGQSTVIQRERERVRGMSTIVALSDIIKDH